MNMKNFLSKTSLIKNQSAAIQLLLMIFKWPFSTKFFLIASFLATYYHQFWVSMRLFEAADNYPPRKLVCDLK